MNYVTRVTRLTVMPDNEPIFSEEATHIEIDDEAAGEFIVVKQQHDKAEPGEVYFTHETWPIISAAVEQLLKEIAE